VDLWTGGGWEVTSGWVRINVGEDRRDGMGRCVMIVRIACAIFPFLNCRYRILGGRIAFYLHFREH